MNQSRPRWLCVEGCCSCGPDGDGRFYILRARSLMARAVRIGRSFGQAHKQIRPPPGSRDEAQGL